MKLFFIVVASIACAPLALMLGVVMLKMIFALIMGCIYGVIGLVEMIARWFNKRES